MAKTRKGLKVTVNLFALDPKTFDAESARLWIKGSVTNEDTKEQKIFNDAGQLITFLGKWSRDKLASLRRRAARDRASNDVMARPS